MTIATIEVSVDRLEHEVLPRLRGTVFHVTTATAYGRIKSTGAILPNAHGRYRFSSPSSATSFGRLRNLICLIDLRLASDVQIRHALQCYYFLDPFVASRTNVFLTLREEVFAQLVPNSAGRAYSPKETVIPDIEVWYPGRLPLHEIALILRVNTKRPRKWDHVDLQFMQKLISERIARVHAVDEK
jgi:hypothetical protein